jgi:hypothetical protein
MMAWIANEKHMEVMRSVELFVGMVVLISAVGFICLAAL